MFEISTEKYRERMNLVQAQKTAEIMVDNVESPKKQRSKKGFSGDDTSEETFEA